MDTEFESIVKEIVQTIAEVGYEPYDQLYGYVTKRKEEFITRNGNAREKIKKLNWLKVKQYVEDWKGHSDGTGRMGAVNAGREETPVVSQSEENT